jgi:excisionase family DNA binding protein
MIKKQTVFNVKTVKEGEFITCREASEIGHKHEVTIRRLLAEKKLTRYKLGRRTLIRREEFMALIQPQEIVAQG